MIPHYRNGKIVKEIFIQNDYISMSDLMEELERSGLKDNYREKKVSINAIGEDAELYLEWEEDMTLKEFVNYKKERTELLSFLGINEENNNDE